MLFSWRSGGKPIESARTRFAKAQVSLPNTLHLRYTSYVLRFGIAVPILAAAVTLIAADKKPSDLTLRDLSGKRSSFAIIAARLRF